MLAWRWSGEDVLVHALPLSHQHGLGGLHATLLAGSHAVIEPRFDPERFCALVREQRATVIMAVPAIYRRLSDWEGIESAGMERLRLAISGSAALPAQLATRVSQWLGALPLERYGSTEAGLVLSNAYHGPRRPGQVGRPLPGIEVRLIDERGGEAEPGADGEIVIRGPQVFDGYLDRPDATAEAFTAEGWFRSGDIGRVDPESGDFEITGRSKEMIVSGGLNVFPREVENVLDEHPSVARSAVAGVPSERWGEEVVAFVVAAGEIDREALIGHCRERLSAYKCPKRVLVVADLPSNEMGKLLRDELLVLAARAP
jgi:malonyl-CoA/methylmalonyl-CoA synthetase